jgi:hypothetical protein
VYYNYRQKLEEILIDCGCALKIRGESDETFDIFINKRGKGFAVGRVITRGKDAYAVLEAAEIYNRNV